MLMAPFSGMCGHSTPSASPAPARRRRREMFEMVLSWDETGCRHTSAYKRGRTSTRILPSVPKGKFGEAAPDAAAALARGGVRDGDRLATRCRDGGAASRALDIDLDAHRDLGHPRRDARAEHAAAGR